MQRWIALSLIAIGLGIGLYNFSIWYIGTTAAQDFTAEETQKAESLQQLVELNTEENPSFDPSSIVTTELDYSLGDETAALFIPRIEKKYDVYWGTDDDTLDKGVGMYVSDLTTVPGGNGHTVLSGHRDTVFTKLGQLELTDTLFVEYDETTFIYEITDIWITDEDDLTVIVEKDESILTLTTCYPFDFVGYAPDRYIIQAEMVAAFPQNGSD